MLRLGSGLAGLGPGSAQLASARRGQGSAWLCPSRPGSAWFGLAWLCSGWLGSAWLGFGLGRPGQAQERPGEAGILISLNESTHPRPHGGNKKLILADARLGIGWARTGLGSTRLGSSWPGFVLALPVSAWLRLARPGMAWLCPGWLGFAWARLGLDRARPQPSFLGLFFSFRL